MPIERPILRLPEGRAALRLTGAPQKIPQPHGPGRHRQGERLGPSFIALARALQRQSSDLTQDPRGIAPERALVFETAGSIQNFVRAARSVGLEVLAELDGDGGDDIPDGFEAPRGRSDLPRTLYATMPTQRAAASILTMWRAHQAEEEYPDGAAPWWRLFDLLIKLRVWGPEDRLPAPVREVLERRLAGRHGDETINVELELFASVDRDARDAWRQEVEAKVRDLGGGVVDQCSIEGRGFVYDAVLASLPVRSLRQLLDDTDNPGGLAWVRGLQFILPQTMAQVVVEPVADEAADRALPPISTEAPIRAAILDGMPVAAHPALDGGVVVEDVHDLAFLSMTNYRHHATSMASLVLRGDLAADATCVPESRIVCVPIMRDEAGGGRSLENRLFVDVVHVALTRLLVGREALSPGVFVVNFSIGIAERRFAGGISALARLLDWWAQEHGVLFVVSAGNVPEAVTLQGVDVRTLDAASTAQKQQAVWRGLCDAAYGRGLMAPAEALNVLTVGAISEDLSAPRAPMVGLRLEADGRRLPALSSAVGLGPFRSIKPDILHTGGIHALRAIGVGEHAEVSVIGNAPCGLVVASPTMAGPRVRRARGTSCAAALTTRAALQSAAALQSEEGPFTGAHLDRRDLALLTRALAINAAGWTDEALAHKADVLERLGPRQGQRAKEDVARYFGYGYLEPERMWQSPAQGVTFVGLGDVRKDGAVIFDVPLPPSLSGDRVPRSLRATIAWFSPVSTTRARYRLAALNAVVADRIDDVDGEEDRGWGLLLKADGPDQNMIEKGTVWSRRLVHGRLASPAYTSGQDLPLRVQCQDASGGGLDADLEIRFALVVTLEVEAEARYDIHVEAQDRLEQRARAAHAVRVRGGATG